MATQGLALALKITGGLGAGFIQSTNRASQELVSLKERSAQLGAELGKEQAAMRAAARGTDEYAAAAARVKALKTQLSGISGEIVRVNAESRKASASIAGMKKRMAQSAAIAATASVAFTAAAAVVVKNAQAYTELRIKASSAGVQVDALAADIRANTAALAGNAEQARSAAQGSLDYFKNLQLLTVGLGSVDAAMAHVAGIDPFAQARMSYEEVRESNLAAIRSALALGDAQERARKLGAIEQVIGADQYAALFRYASLTDEQRARVDDLRRRQEAATQSGASGWNRVAFSAGMLRGEVGLLTETMAGPFADSFGRVLELANTGVQRFSRFAQQNETLGRWLGYGAVTAGGLAAALTALIGASAIYRGALFALTGATQTSAAWEAIRTGLIWRSAKALAMNTFAVGRNVVAWLVSRGVMVAGAIATGVMTAAQWALNVALTANPIGIVVVAIGALVAGLVIAYQKSEKFRNVVQFAWQMLKRFWPVLLRPIGFAVKGFQMLYQRSERFRAILQKIWDIAKKVGKALGALVGLNVGGEDVADADQRHRKPPGLPPDYPPVEYPDFPQPVEYPDVDNRGRPPQRPPVATPQPVEYPDVAQPSRPPQRPPVATPQPVEYPDVAQPSRPPQRPPVATPQPVEYPDVAQPSRPPQRPPVATPQPVEYPDVDNRGRPVQATTVNRTTNVAGDNLTSQRAVTEIHNTFTYPASPTPKRWPSGSARCRNRPPLEPAHDHAPANRRRED